MDSNLEQILKHQEEIKEKENEVRIEKYKEKYSKLGERLDKDREFNRHSGYMKEFFEKGYTEIGVVPPKNQDLPHREILFFFYNGDKEN